MATQRKPTTLYGNPTKAYNIHMRDEESLSLAFLKRSHEKNSPDLSGTCSIPWGANQERIQKSEIHFLRNTILQSLCSWRIIILMLFLKRLRLHWVMSIKQWTHSTKVVLVIVTWLQGNKRKNFLERCLLSNFDIC